jgi:hypothetical protein
MLFRYPGFRVVTELFEVSTTELGCGYFHGEYVRVISLVSANHFTSHPRDSARNLIGTHSSVTDYS